MTTRPALAFSVLVLSAIPSTQGAAQSEPMSVDAALTVSRLAPFRAVQLRNGGKAILRHGPTQRVTFVRGGPDQASVTVGPEGELVIDKRKARGAGRSDLEIEIVTPEVARVTVAHGGTIQSRGTFPSQSEIGARVDNGGTIDIRSMSVERVAASVLSGGRILVRPQAALAASIVDGGNVTYWGDPRVTRSIEHAGVVERGEPSEIDTPPSDVGRFITPPPPAPAVSPKDQRRSP